MQTKMLNGGRGEITVWHTFLVISAEIKLIKHYHTLVPKKY